MESLNNLGILLYKTGRMAEAEEAYRESLSIRRSLAGAEPTAWLPDLAGSLNNLGLLLKDTSRIGLAGNSFRLAAEAGRLAKESAEAQVDNASFLAEVDVLLSASSSTQDSIVLSEGMHAEIVGNTIEDTSSIVRKAIIDLVESNPSMRLRDAHHAKQDVAASVSTYADNVDPGDVLAVVLVVRGFFRRRVSGYFCTSEALYSSFLDGSNIPFAEVRRVELAASGVRITPFEGDGAVVDFGEFNEEVHKVLSRVLFALKRARGPEI